MPKQNAVGKIMQGFVAILILSTSISAFASSSSTQNGEWEVSIAPYIWFVSIKGDTTVKGSKSSVDTNIFDIYDNVNFAGELHAEIWKGKWGFLIDPTYVVLSADEKVAGSSLDVKMKYFLMDFAAMYRFAKVDALAGGRITHLDTELDFSPGPTISGDKTWVSPIVGLRSEIDITNNFSLILRGDVGGFGIGSDFTWSANGLFVHKLSKRADLLFGYRVLSDDYKTGSGASKFAYDMVVHGPILGINFKF